MTAQSKYMAHEVRKHRRREELKKLVQRGQLRAVFELYADPYGFQEWHGFSMTKDQKKDTLEALIELAEEQLGEAE